MSAITNIALADAETVPVTHTFNPAKQGLMGTSGQRSIADYEDRAANTGIPVGFYRINSEFNRPNKDRKSYRVTYRLMTPILETISNSTVSGILPAPTVGFTPLVEITFVLPERASLQYRKNLRKMAYGLLNDSQVVNAVENLDFPL